MKILFSLILGILLGGVITYFFLKSNLIETSTNVKDKQTSAPNYNNEINNNPETNKTTEETNLVKKEVSQSIKVATLKDFLMAIGDNRTIEITQPINITQELVNVVKNNQFKAKKIDHVIQNLYPGNLTYIAENKFYNIVLNDREYSDVTIENETFDMKSFGVHNFYFTIKNTVNLTIKGLENSSSFIIENKDSPVLNFNNNINLSLEQIQAKHDLPVEDECGIHAPVFQFIDDKNVVINKCSMDGSGTEGVYAMNVNSLKINESKIFNCSRSALSLINLNSCVLNHSIIAENNFSTIFNLNGANLFVNNTTIKQNTTILGFINKCFTANPPVFILHNDEKITFKYCPILENKISDNTNFIHKNIKEFFDETNTVDLNQFEYIDIDNQKESNEEEVYEEEEFN